ncbi:LacI family DNA-binding transcriptional regulator [Paraliobacillus salinarum]|uniref:LacI family DNA-binding transcriptional regulator n=1 Tax=Paraliobacillus salinarum TaxID=1158996 RepID=UPI001FECC85E|nr:LacI family DNA-binding transcriptional regulator [Paraliobacillus salinarum]
MIMKITLKDIAEKANVSVTTVSLVLNNRPNRISPKKKQLIKHIAREHNYTANQLARGLVKKETRMLGLILPDIGNPFYSSLAKKLEQACRKEGYTLIVSNTNNKYEQDLKLLHFLLTRSVDGIFIIPSFEAYQDNTKLIEKLEQLPIPYVMLERSFLKYHCDKITFANEQGAYQAVKHLIEMGHKKIGFIANFSNSTNVNLRLNGYMKAMNEHNYEISPDYIVEGYYQEECGYQAGRKLLDTDVTAVFIINDMMTLGFLKLLNQLNKKVPEDISVVSYDETINSCLIGLQLTSIRKSVTDLAQHGFSLLISRIKEPEKPYEEICLTTKLIKHDSVRELSHEEIML